MSYLAVEDSIDLERIEAALSSKYHAFVFLTPETTPPTLIAALQSQFPKVDSNSWTHEIMRGGTYVNGLPVFTDCPLPAPCRIEYYEPKHDWDKNLRNYAAQIDRHIVHEDHDLLVVYKPSGIASLATREQKVLNLKNFLEDYLASTDPSAKLHMPSRVDTSVEGLVVASKNSETHAILQRAFERRQVDKTYILATASDFPEERVEANRAIDRDPRHPILRKTVHQGGKPSLTVFTKLGNVTEAVNDEMLALTVVQAKPVTGRTHQIRVHAKSYGFPIAGDNFYGGVMAESLHLVSYRSSFLHPGTNTKVEFIAPEKHLPSWLKTYLQTGNGSLRDP